MVGKTWLITGASRGFGAEIAKAALAAGDTVIATARNQFDKVCGGRHYRSPAS